MSVKRRNTIALILLLGGLVVLAGLPFSGTGYAGADPAKAAGESGKGGTARESREAKLARFEQATEELYRSMQEGYTQQALEDMERLTDALTGLSFKGLTSVEGIHALAESVMDVQQTLIRAEVSPDDWMFVSAKLRLAANSLVHRDDALWLQYYKVMHEQMDNIENGRISGSRTSVREAFLGLKRHYDVIRPAVVIRKEAWEISRFDSWMSHVDGLSEEQTLNGEALGQALKQGEKFLKELFGKTEDPVFLPVTGYGKPVYWSLLIGGWIVLALGYTGLRKYMADQTVMAAHSPKDRDDSYRF